MRMKGAVTAGLSLGLLVGQGVLGHAEDRRGRKYKEPPPTSHIEVLVTKEGSDKPISNAAVIFRARKDGKDDGNLELKTDPDGKAALDVITTGSSVQVQVFAKGYATFAEVYQIDVPAKAIRVELQRPREQVSAYQDNTGKASTRTWGVQEPVKATPAAPAGAGLQKRAPDGKATPDAGGAEPQAGQDGAPAKAGDPPPKF